MQKLNMRFKNKFPNGILVPIIYEWTKNGNTCGTLIYSLSNMTFKNMKLAATF